MINYYHHYYYQSAEAKLSAAQCQNLFNINTVTMVMIIMINNIVLYFFTYPFMAIGSRGGARSGAMSRSFNIITVTIINND